MVGSNHIRSWYIWTRFESLAYSEMSRCFASYCCSINPWYLIQLSYQEQSNFKMHCTFVFCKWKWSPSPSLSLEFFFWTFHFYFVKKKSFQSFVKKIFSFVPKNVREIWVLVHKNVIIDNDMTIIGMTFHFHCN